MVSFAIVTGADIAIESADIVLMISSLLVVVDAVGVSKATLRNIKPHLFGAFIYNTLGILIGAEFFYFLMGLLLSRIIAGAAMTLSSVTVLSSANQLQFFRRREKT